MTEPKNRTRVAIIGAGGHGREVADILRSLPHLDPLGFIEENPERAGSKLDGLPVLGDWSWFEGASREGLAVIVAVGTPAVCQRLAERAAGLGLEFASAVSGDARISPAAELGPGVVVFPGVVVNTGARIGAFTTLNLGVSVSHDSQVGRYCNLNPGARLAGSVVVGDGCYLGMGANVIQGRRIGAWSTIGAGAAVVRDVPDHATAAGVPARIIQRKADFP